ncbi:PaaI family thioesterase [bacterium]|nr:PaaI family thioesterase [bacterium]
MELSEDLKKRLSERLEKSALAKLFGVNLTEVRLDFAEMKLRHSDLVSNASGKGTINGGILAMLCDTVAAFSLATNFDGQMSFATVDLSVHYLSRAKTEIIAQAKTLRKGSRINVLEVEVFDLHKVLVAKATVTFILTKEMHFLFGKKIET